MNHTITTKYSRPRFTGEPARLFQLWRWLQARPAVLAALLYALLSLALFSPAMFTGRALSPSDYLWFVAPWSHSRPGDITHVSNVELIDLPFAIEPWLHYAASRFPAAPLWNPYEAAGRPFIGNAQSAVFSPFTLPAYVLPFGFALGLIAALKTWTAAFGMFLFARALRMRTASSLLAGTAYGFNLLLIAVVGFPASSIWALFPWLLLSTEFLVRKPTRLAACGLAGVTAAQYLCGHPESSFFAMMLVVAYAALRVLARARGRSTRTVLRTVALMSASLAGGLALAAVVVFPFVDLLGQAIESSTPPGAALARLPFKDILGLMTPYFEGGGASQSAPGIYEISRFIYIGALPLLLAAATLVGRRSIQQRWIAAFGIVLLVVALGVPPFFSFVHLLPGFHQSDLRRLAILTLLAIALLAGFGADLLASARLPRRRGQLLAIGWLVLMAVPPVWVGLAKSWSWLVVSALAGGLVAWRIGGRLAARHFDILAVGLTAANLLVAGFGFNPASQEAVLPVTGAIAYLREHVPSRFVATGGYVLPANVGMDYGLLDARSYDQPIERRYYKLWTTAIEPGFPAAVRPHLDVPSLSERALTALNLLSVSDILVPPGVSVPPLAGLRLAYSGPDADIYANSSALPRAFVVSNQQTIAREQSQLLAVESPTFQRRSVVVTDHPLAGIPVDAPRSSAGAARIISYAPDQVRVTVHASRESVLVLTDGYFPGWTASVNGRSANVERVDYLLRGVRVGSGTSTVIFRYQPGSWRLGWIISLIALIVWLGTLASALLQRRGVQILLRRSPTTGTTAT